MEWLPDFNVLAVLTAFLVGVAKTGVSGLAILVVPLIAIAHGNRGLVFSDCEHIKTTNLHLS